MKLINNSCSTVPQCHNIISQHNCTNQLNVTIALYIYKTKYYSDVLVHLYHCRVLGTAYLEIMEQKKKQKLWTKEKALSYIRSFYRTDIEAADLLRLINNSLPPNKHALSSNLFYIAYHIFIKSSNIVKVPVYDCSFCDCIGCVDFDSNNNHGSCSICGICFYIPADNSRCLSKGGFHTY